VTFTFGKVLKPFFKLSADEFPKLAAERYGQNDDMDRIWLQFEPVARYLAILQEWSLERLSDGTGTVPPEQP